MQMGIISGITVPDDNLIIYSGEAILLCTDALNPGQTRVYLSSGSGLSSGKELCFFDNGKGECAVIQSVEPDSIVLTAPLQHSYMAGAYSLVLLRRIFYFQDGQVLRRKVNDSPAQPLHEETASFVCSFDQAANLVRLSIEVQGQKEETYVLNVFPKNLALVEPK